MLRAPSQTFVVVREEERGYAAAVHLLNAIPLWGFLFTAGMWVWFKERSREVVFHVQQAMVFQMVFLAVIVFFLAVNLLGLPVRVLAPAMADLMSRLNFFFLVSCYTAYAGVCLAGTVMTLLGRSFLYPFVGRRVLSGSLTKSSNWEE